MQIYFSFGLHSTTVVSMKSRVLTYSREADSATLMWVKGARRSETQRQNHSWGSFQGQHGDFEGGTSL